VLAHQAHEEVLSEVRKQLSDIFDESQQSVYVYLDGMNKICNKRFASLLGYDSPKQWAAVRKSFPEAFVSPKDRTTLVSAYDNAMNGLIGSTISIRWKKKEGGEVPTTTILVPFVFGGHRMALHFVSPS
jgi:hypothetical protein